MPGFRESEMSGDGDAELQYSVHDTYIRTGTLSLYGFIYTAEAAARNNFLIIHADLLGREKPALRRAEGGDKLSPRERSNIEWEGGGGREGQRYPASGGRDQNLVDWVAVLLQDLALLRISKRLLQRSYYIRVLWIAVILLGPMVEPVSQ